MRFCVENNFQQAGLDQFTMTGNDGMGMGSVGMWVAQQKLDTSGAMEFQLLCSKMKNVPGQNGFGRPL